MIIRKEYSFENAHIVRECSTLRCSQNIHGHSYRVEIKIKSNFLDNAGMVLDFGLIKLSIKDIIESFDHSITLWSKDDQEYIKFAKKFNQRYVVLPVNPSVEQFCRVFFLAIDRILEQTKFINGEKNVKLHSIIVHETATGYAECFREDAYNFENMGEIDLKDVEFSNAIKNDWKDKNLWDKILNNGVFINPKSV